MLQNQVVFVIMPISGTKHATSKEWQSFYLEVIKPAVETAGFICKRSDTDIKRGNIVGNIIKFLADSYVVIADITDYNPNVMYELGVRHALAGRTIMIAREGTRIPFDIKSYWYKEYDPADKESLRELTLFIKEALENIRKNPYAKDNPVADFISTRRTKIKISREEKEHYEIATELVKSAQHRVYVIERTPVLLVKDIYNQWQKEWYEALKSWLNMVVKSPRNKLFGLLFIASKTAKIIKRLDKEREFFKNLKKFKNIEKKTTGKGVIICAIPEYCGSFIVSDYKVGIWYKTDTNETGIYVTELPELSDAYVEVFFRLCGEKRQSTEEIIELIKRFI